MKTQAARPLLLWSASACVLLQLGSLHAETLTVTSLADSGDGTLRAAIASAVSGDTVEIPLAGSINLQSTLRLDRPVTIHGPGSEKLKVRRGEGVTAKFSVFEIRNSGGISISHLTLSNGFAKEGGAINASTDGPIVLEDCLLIGNHDDATGAGGGAIFLHGGTNTTIRRCVIQNNVSRSTSGTYPGGGGISVSKASVLLENSSIVGNYSAGFGGGVHINAGTAEVRNCTFSGNTSLRGGGSIGITPAGRLVLLSSTLTRNNGASPGILNRVGHATIGNSILSGNLGTGGDYSGSDPVSLGYNLVGDDGYGTRFTGPGDVVGVTDPLLAPLAYYGGSTLIHPPTFNSVHVIDKGKSTLGDVSLPTDQHGNPRPARAHWQDPAPGGDFSDIGAVELGEMSQSGGTVVVNTTDDSDDGVPGKLHCSLREALNYVNVLAAKDERIIRFDPRLFGPGKPRREIALLTALPALSDTRLEGPGAKHLTVRRAAVPAFSVLHADGVERSFISGLTLENGNSTYGGGIYASAPITVEGCHVRNCIARLRGGGIFCKTGGLAMKRCTLSNNISSDGGAGLFTSALAPSQIENSTFDGNRAVGGFGGGILAEGEVTLTACTLTRGYAHRAGGGIAALGYQGTLITLRNCIVSGNEHADVCGSGHRSVPGIVSGGYNLVGTLFYNPDLVNGTRGDLVGFTDPKLSPLKDNGGPTPTMALRRGSPALDRGLSFGLATDQRGFARTVDHPFLGVPRGSGDETDIGAFELQLLTFDEWRRQGFASDDQLAAALGQPDGDANASGVPNALKHLFGIDPLLPLDAAGRAALPRISGYDLAGVEHLVITYRRSAFYFGPEEVVESSSDLIHWEPAVPHQISTGPVSTKTHDRQISYYFDAAGLTKIYFRVSVPE